MKKRNSYIFFIAVSLLTGALSALITRSNMNLFGKIIQPALTPPSVVFPVVWTILFTLMGISAARIFIANEYKWNVSLTIWTAQLAVNFLWSIIFFNFQVFLFAFLWLLLLWALIVTMIILFYQEDKFASILQVPYLLWVTFAGYLTLSIFLLNN